MNDNNYLKQINDARNKNAQPNKAEFEKSMGEVKKYSEALKGLKQEDLESLNSLMDKIDGMSDVFEKYAKIQDKVERLQANASSLERSMEKLAKAKEENPIDPFEGYTEDETININMQVIKEFETESRLSRDLLEASKDIEIDFDVPDGINNLDNLTTEQTLQVYMQVAIEFQDKTELANRLAYNAGV